MVSALRQGAEIPRVPRPIRRIAELESDVQADVSVEANSLQPPAPRWSGDAAELTVIVPTFNERDNIGPLVDLLEQALTGIRWEAIFVDDDSPDGTAARVREIAQRKPYIRCVQ